MTTTRDLLESSLRLIGQLAEGETASAETMADALEAMNAMIESWSVERLSIFATQDQQFTWPSNAKTKTLGPSGDFVGNRPIEMDDSTYFRDASLAISLPITLINQKQYDDIPVKDVTSTYPQVMFINYDMPNITMSVYPVPTKALEWHFISVDELSQPANLSTVLAFPPGYKRAFKYNTAVEIATEFGIEPPPNVLRIAIASKRILKRINNPMDVMELPNEFPQLRRRFNIFAGNY